MIIILNGSIGIGKTSTAWKLNELLDQSVMLDGDFLGAVNPFDLHDANRVSYLYDTISHLIEYHQSHGYKNFVINYVFETEAELNELINKLKRLIPVIHSYWLTCDVEEQRKRIIQRNTDQVDWELNRMLELNSILNQSSETGFIGRPIDTSQLTIEHAALNIFNHVNKK